MHLQLDTDAFGSLQRSYDAKEVLGARVPAWPKVEAIEFEVSPINCLPACLSLGVQSILSRAGQQQHGGSPPTITSIGHNS